MVADSIVLVALEITRSPIVVQALTSQVTHQLEERTASGNSGSVESKVWEVWTSYLRQCYGEQVVVDENSRTVRFEIDEATVLVDFPGREVQVVNAEDKADSIKDDITQSLKRCEAALQPVPRF